MHLCINVFSCSYAALLNCETENALAHQASVLHSDLEKSIQENALLFSKIGNMFFFLTYELDPLFSLIGLAKFSLLIKIWCHKLQQEKIN